MSGVLMVKRKVLNLASPRGSVGLAGSVIIMAIRGMRDYDIEQIGERIDSTCWLASKAATPWFDIANVDQPFALAGMDWARHAADLLAGDALRVAHWLEFPSRQARPLVSKRIRLLERGLEYFDEFR